MWEGAWAAAPRGIPACLGKHSCKDPAVLVPGHIHRHSEAGLNCSHSSQVMHLLFLEQDLGG